MGSLFDWITDWIKEGLIEAITGQYTSIFESVNNQVADVAGQVGQTPQGWNGGVFSMIQNLSETVVIPIAGIILTFVLVYELIQMILEKNNMHDDVCCKRCISNASNTTYSQLICGRMI